MISDSFWAAVITGGVSSLISIGGGLVLWGMGRQKITDQIAAVEKSHQELKTVVEDGNKALASKIEKETVKNELKIIEFDSNNRRTQEKLEKDVQDKLQRVEEKMNEMRDMLIQIATRMDIKPMFRKEGG